jgi:hypothetical protein
MLRFNLFFAAVLSSLFIMTSCHTAKRYVETGDYDGAIDHCIDKLSGRKKKSEELVKGLELAFQKATDRDMRAADALIAENRPSNWERINQIHRQIKVRQEKVMPLIPLQTKDGYTAKFLFVNIEKLESNSRANAAEYLYNMATEDLQSARKGDKTAAKNAYNTLCELEQKYYNDYKNKEDMKREASALGIVYVIFDIKNESNRLLPRDFNDRVLAISKSDLDTKWRRYHFKTEPGVAYDYKATFRLNNIDISPERIRERIYTDEREVQDGWEYVYDDKGNVKKDTLGKDIKHERWIMVRANVIEVQQSKAARINGYVEVYNANGTQRLESRNVATEILFEHFASTFNGDARALSDQTRCRIGSRPAPFPMDEDMLVQAADRLKPSIAQELCNCIR